MLAARDIRLLSCPFPAPLTVTVEAASPGWSSAHQGTTSATWSCLATENSTGQAVDVADLADFFRLALEDEVSVGDDVIGNGVESTVAELTEAAAVAVGAPGAVPGSDDEARARLGDYFAEVLLLDEATNAAKARAELGWQPSHRSLVDEFLHGSYRKRPPRPPCSPCRVEARRTGRGVPRFSCHVHRQPAKDDDRRGRRAMTGP